MVERLFLGYEGERRVANEACPNGANTHKACLAAKWLKGFFWGMRENGGGFFGRREYVFPAADKKLPAKINPLGRVMKKIKKNALLSENIALLNFSVTHS